MSYILGFCFLTNFWLSYSTLLVLVGWHLTWTLLECLRHTAICHPNFHEWNQLSCGFLLRIWGYKDLLNSSCRQKFFFRFFFRVTYVKYTVITFTMQPPIVLFSFTLFTAGLAAVPQLSAEYFVQKMTNITERSVVEMAVIRDHKYSGSGGKEVRLLSPLFIRVSINLF